MFASPSPSPDQEDKRLRSIADLRKKHSAENYSLNLPVLHGNFEFSKTTKFKGNELFNKTSLQHFIEHSFD